MFTAIVPFIIGFGVAAFTLDRIEQVNSVYSYALKVSGKGSGGAGASGSGKKKSSAKKSDSKKKSSGKSNAGSSGKGSGGSDGNKKSSGKKGDKDSRSKSTGGGVGGPSSKEKDKKARSDQGKRNRDKQRSQSTGGGVGGPSTRAKQVTTNRKQASRNRSRRVSGQGYGQAGSGGGATRNITVRPRSNPNSGYRNVQLSPGMPGEGNQFMGGGAMGGSASNTLGDTVRGLGGVDNVIQKSKAQRDKELKDYITTEFAKQGKDPLGRPLYGNKTSLGGARGPMGVLEQEEEQTFQ